MRRILLLLIFGPAVAAARPPEMIAQRKDVQTAVNSSVVNEARIGISIAWVAGNLIPRDAAALGEAGETVPPESAPDSGIGALRIDRGTIIVTLGGKVHVDLVGKIFALSPCVNDHDIHFACGRSQCRAGFALAPGAPDAAALTTLDPAVLPAACRQSN